MAKTLIRSDMLARRRHVSAQSSLEWSRRIQDSVLRLPEFRLAGRMALYSPIQNEVATADIFRAARESGKEVVFPTVRERHLEFAMVSHLGELETGSFGIAEPRTAASVPLGSIDLLIIPGVAFDLSGHRLGYGKGYYDRLLYDPEERGVLAGLCFEVQLIESLPAGVHDVRMDLLVTEDRVLRFEGLAAGRRYTSGGELT